MREPTNETITQEELKKILSYSKDTGEFTWIQKANKFSNVGVGSVADRVSGSYKVISINRKAYKSHRLVWLYFYGHFPDEMIDHIDCDSLNNRVENLRLATSSNNNWNRTLNSNTKTGVKGVRIHQNGNYEARIMCNKISYYLGVFDSLKDAEQAVRAKRLELHGEYTRDE